jgi:3-deoxy-7-phosphoheptulonate synthase
VGADGLLIDVHPQPKTALCDGDQALHESDIKQIADIVAGMSPFMGRKLAVPSGEFGHIPAGV